MDISNIRQKDCPTPEMPTYDLPGLAAALADGCRLHVFRSGGGLRVARLEKDDSLKGYGEHPYVETALEHAAEDYMLGGRPYGEVYGEKYDHYLTGASDPSSELDRQIIRGRSLDAWKGDDGRIVCRISGLAHTPSPENMMKAVMDDGCSRRFEHRGFVYEISRSRLPNGNACTSISVVDGRKAKDGSDAWMFEVAKTGRGWSFVEACAAAVEAEEIEVAI